MVEIGEERLTVHEKNAARRTRFAKGLDKLQRPTSWLEGEV